jgi:NADPH2:quinone reductase
MTKAVRVHQVGGPEALVYESVDVPAPGPGEVRIRQHAVGLNFIDVYFRISHRPLQGPGTSLHRRQRGGGRGGLGRSRRDEFPPRRPRRLLPQSRCLYRRAQHPLGAAGQAARPHHLRAGRRADALGAHVIGTVGSRQKAELAEANGCDHVILYNEEDFVARVKQISRNEGCDVVYDGVGKATFPGSLSCLKPRGMFVSFGNASGPVPPFAIAELNNHGSLFATRPKLNDYIGKRSELLEGADTLFAAVISGKLHVPINHAYALKDAAKAHIDLESRATTGASILKP